MQNIKYLTGLIIDHGRVFYGSETPEYMASQWVEALPEADLQDFHEWFSHGFWAPDVARALSDMGVLPWEVPSNVVYDLCNGDLSVPLFLRTWRR